MTTRDVLPAIGVTILVRCESLKLRCTVIDAKVSYGTPRVLVRPVAGQGEQWVGLDRVTLERPSRGRGLIRPMRKTERDKSGGNDHQDQRQPRSRSTKQWTKVQSGGGTSSRWRLVHHERTSERTTQDANE